MGFELCAQPELQNELKKVLERFFPGGLYKARAKYWESDGTSASKCRFFFSHAEAREWLLQLKMGHENKWQELITQVPFDWVDIKLLVTMNEGKDER